MNVSSNIDFILSSVNHYNRIYYVLCNILLRWVFNKDVSVFVHKNPLL